MRKKVMCTLMITFCISTIYGCKSTTENKNEDVFEEKDAEQEGVEEISINSIDDNYATQLETLEKLKEEWKIEDFKFETSYGEIIELEDYAYAISDLDRDGNLEIIVTGWAGTGHFSYNRIFEYKDNNVLEEINLEAVCYKDSEPDLLLQNEINNDYISENEIINGFIDDDGNINYILTDKEYWGSDEGEIRYLLLAINDNEYECKLLAYMQNKEHSTFYYNENEEEITEEKFENIIESISEGNEICQISLGWFYDISLENLEKSFGVWNKVI